MLRPRNFGASLRTVAAEAGVPAALIVHHSGSKQGLVEACDARVLGVADEKVRLMNNEGLASATAWVIEVMQQGDVPAYISRALVDVTEKALLEFDLVEPRMTAALLVTHSLGAMVLRDHISAATGMAPYGDGLVSFAFANLALYQGVLSPLFKGLE